tara:strand:- start:519 stop:1517 length:999 start_codon:yes stop_codon:yes gene_type:complete
MIIISRCPYRISLLGGGSDLDWYVKEKGYGKCLGYSLSKYSYIVLNKLQSNANRGVLNYSSREEYEFVDDIAHPLIRSALESFKVYEPVEISSFGFAAKGSGLGGSSSFLIALINAISVMRNKNYDASYLAKLASDIEINVLKKPIGRQDHYISAAGGISCYKFNSTNQVDKISLSRPKIDMLNRIIGNLYIVPSFVSRSADRVLHNIKNVKSSSDDITQIRKLADDFISTEEDRQSILENKFNESVRDSWEIKKRMSSVMSGILNDQYNVLTKIPLNWIRLLGAGSGGYFLISPKLSQADTESQLQSLKMHGYTKASLTGVGVEIIHENKE